MSEPDIYLGVANLHAEPETSTVKLDIPWEWRIWSEYRFGGVKVRWNNECKWWELEEPMDEDGFDESTAFPLLKPAIDVFGPPRLSQRQRGWYYVKPWPPRSPSSPLDPDSRPAMATAAEILEELFERILHEIAWIYRDRHTLAKCGQVCHYWASQCRPGLFNKIHLRSRQDVLSLRAWKKDPACRFLPYLHIVVIEVAALSTLNWVHLSTQIADGCQLYLRLTGPLPASTKTLRSIHQAIPRSLPPSFSPKICTLSLTDIRFRRFEDLTHLVGELPGLKTLSCRKVTWESLPTEPARRPPTVDRIHSCHWRMHECSPLCTRAATFLLHSMLSRASIYNDPLAVLLSLLELLDLAHTVAHTSIFAWNLHSRSNYIHLWLRHGDLDFNLGAELYGSDSAFGGSPSFRLTVFAITPYKVHEWASVDWSKLDIFIDKLPFLRIVVFGFWDWSRKSMLRFAEEVVDEQMPLSSRRNLIRYAVRGSMVEGGWRQASRETAELQNPGSYFLHEMYA